MNRSTLAPAIFFLVIFLGVLVFLGIFIQSSVPTQLPDPSVMPPTPIDTPKVNPPEVTIQSPKKPTITPTIPTITPSPTYTSTPMKIVIAIDKSRSMSINMSMTKPRVALEAVKDAVESLFYTYREKEVSFPVYFSIKVFCKDISEKIDNINILDDVDFEKALDDIRNIDIEFFERTYIYDVIIDSLETKNQVNAIIIFTDGFDESIYPIQNSIPEKENWIYQQTKIKGIPIFIVGIGAHVKYHLIYRIATESGGGCLFNPSPGELHAFYINVINYLRDKDNEHLKCMIPE